MNKIEAVKSTLNKLIKILFFIFKVLSPYKFATVFEKELAALQAEMDKL